MSPRIPRFVVAVFAVVAVLAPALAQRTELDQLKKPTTVPQYWAAVKAEINVGKFDAAAEMIKGLLALNPTEKDLLAIEEKEGIGAFLDLNSIPKWSNNDVVEKEARENVQKLINLVTAAVQKLRSNPEVIQKYIRNITAGTPEERDYAFLELRKSGPAIMPQLIGTIQNVDLRDRAVLLGFLPKFGAETVPAILAALENNNPTLQVDFINALAARDDILELTTRSHQDPRPTLVRLSQSAGLVGEKARQLLVAVTQVSANKLPPAAQELTRFADQLYQHKHQLPKTGAIPMWKWDGRQVVASTGTVSQAEEFFGLRYARWAIEREPNYLPAHVTFLSLATEKAIERGGIESRLSKSAPAVHELLAGSPPAVLYTMLDRAIDENHLTVALAVTQVLGERAEIHAPTKIDPMVKALNSQDRRLALAAAEALIRMPNGVGTRHASRIVEVFRQALAVPPGSGGASDGASRRPRALIADPNEVRSRLLADVVERAGFDPVVAPTGRESIRRLNQAGDIDVIWVNHELVYPMLPEFLAQVRADYRYGRLPLFVTVSADNVVAKARLPVMEVRLEKLEDYTRAWVYNDASDLTMRLAKKAQNNGSVRDDRDQRKFVVDRLRYPMRVDFHYDALKLNAEESRYLSVWLEELSREYPNIRQTKVARQRIMITIMQTTAGLEPRLQQLTEGLPGVTARRVSETLLILDLSTAEMPPVLADRVGLLLRDFTYETKEGVRSLVLALVREMPTTISLTSADAPPPLEVGQSPTTRSATAVDANAATPNYNPLIEKQKIRRAISDVVEARLQSVLGHYKNVQLVAEPLNPNEVRSAMRHMYEISGPMITPLSEAERKDHARRAIEALRLMAIGSIAGYDVRPAAAEILDALRNDDLAPAAIEASGRLSGKDPQFALADVVVNAARPANVRKLAGDELVRSLQRVGPTSISDPQIRALIKLQDEEKNPDVKAGVVLVLGSIPRERVAGLIADPKAREQWINRVLNYQPQAPAAPTPEPKPEPKPVPKENNN